MNEMKPLLIDGGHRYFFRKSSKDDVVAHLRLVLLIKCNLPATNWSWRERRWLVSQFSHMHVNVRRLLLCQNDCTNNLCGSFRTHTCQIEKNTTTTKRLWCISEKQVPTLFCTDWSWTVWIIFSTGNYHRSLKWVSGTYSAIQLVLFKSIQRICR